MKIFSWVQNKLGGRNVPVLGKKCDPNSDCYKKLLQPRNKELDECPHQMFLAIGMLGSIDSKDVQEKITYDRSTSTNDVSIVESNESFQSEKRFLPLQNQNNETDHEDYNVNLSKDTSMSVVVNGDISLENNGKNGNGAIGKKSLSFLFKKIFACKSGFPLTPPTPNLMRDSILETRLEQILRGILYKKIHMQNSPVPTKLCAKKYLQNKHMAHRVSSEDATRNEDSKWLKTNSEYIVLEV